MLVLGEHACWSGRGPGIWALLGDLIIVPALMETGLGSPRSTQDGSGTQRSSCVMTDSSLEIVAESTDSYTYAVDCLRRV